jgi:hypothetical protein
MTPVYRPGFFCDVFALPDGRLGQVYESGLTVVCEVEGAHLWMTPAPEPLMFCRCAVHNGDVFTIHQGHDSGRALLIGGGFVKDLGPTFGVQPVAIDSRYVYIVRDSNNYERIDLTTAVVETLPSGAPGSSQGISDVIGGALWWADWHRTWTHAGLPTLTYPNQRGSVVVGQADPPQIAGWIDMQRAFTAFDGDGYEPHVVQSGERYALCARTSRGAAYLVVPPYPAAAAPAPEPAPKPVPVPQPKPEPVPMQGLTDAQFATLQRVRAKYGATVTPAEIGAILNETAWVHRAEGLGLQAKNGGTVAFQPRTNRMVWNGIRIGSIGQDVLGGASIGLATPTRGEVGPADPASFVAPVEPLGTVPAPPPVPVPVPVPPTPNLPTLDQWINGEYPQLVEAYRSRHNGDDPGHTWAAFQTCRRGGVMLAPGEAAWSFAKMLDWELRQ